jgi:hypothetical protein
MMSELSVPDYQYCFLQRLMELRLHWAMQI